MPEQTQEEQLTEILKDTVDAEIQWGSPVVYVAQAVQEILRQWTLTPKVPEQAVRHKLADLIYSTLNPEITPEIGAWMPTVDGTGNQLSHITADVILERWNLTPKVPEHSHSWVDSLDGDMKCSSCPAVHHYSM